MKKRIFSFLLVLVLVMVITMMPVLEIEAQAASYDATAAVAYANAHWEDTPEIDKADCANFVSKCLATGGISIPKKANYYTANTPSYNNNSGKLGKFTNPHTCSAALLKYLSETYEVITDPQISDIEIGDVIFVTSNGVRDGHTGIVIYADGKTAYYAGHTKPTNRGDLSGGRCNYVVKMRGILTSPDKPDFTVTETYYAEGSDILISWNETPRNSYYWINVFKDGELIVDQSMDYATSYILPSAEIGDYSVLLSANNVVGGSLSDPYVFYVIENTPPKAPVISASQTHFKTGDSVTISWDPVDGAAIYNYYVTEYPTEFAYETNVKSGSTEDLSVTFSDLPNGKYLVFVQGINLLGSYSDQSNYLWIDVYNQDYTATKTEIWNGHLYALYDGEMSWDFAQALCEMENGHLVTITSEKENILVKSLLEYGTGDGYWIGARNDDIADYETVGNEFRWITGEEFSYSNWADGEPNGMGTGVSVEHFAEIRKSYQNEWNDVAHTTKNGFVLEVDVSKFEPAATASYGGNEYLRFDENITWTEASAYCESIGGHLAIISSQEEDNVISELINKGEEGRNWYYIGGKTSSEIWMWNDGTEVPLSGDSANWSDVGGNKQNGPTGWGDYLMKYRSTGTWIGIQNFYLPKGNIAGIGFVCEIENQSPEHKDDNQDYICDLCGESMCTEHIGITVKDKAATCTADGYSGDEVCKSCGKTIKNGDVIKAKGHAWDDGKVTKEATCTQDGLMVYTCKNDPSHTKEESIGGGVHQETVIEGTPATCTETGLTSGEICSKCGAVLQEQEVIPALGHDTELKNTKESTCNAAGYTGDEVCKTCGKTIKNGDAIPAPGHTWDSGKVTKDATETEEGLMLYTCTACGETKEEVIPKPIHIHKYQETVTNPTCTEQGYTQFTCSCGDSYADNYVEPIGHDTELKNAKEATCTADGYSAADVCKTCGKTVKSGDVIKAKGHTMDDGKVVKEPTEDAEGLKRFTCTVCRETKDEIIPKLDHTTHNYVAEIIAPNCTEAGYTLFTCACGNSYKDNITDALGHDAELKNAKEATCTADGYSGDEVCKTCGKTVKSGDVIKAKGHTMDDGKVVKEPTEDAEGVKRYTCTVCGETEEKVIPPIDHEHAFEQTLVKPTCMDAGYTEYVCDCGESYREDYVNATGHSFKNGKCSVCGAVDPTPIENPFVDVTKSDYFYAPVLWAVQEGVTGGTGPNTFSPNNPCTRGQVVTFLWAASGRPEPKSSINPFSDVGPADYYYKAVLWAVENGITGGIGNGQFGPNQPCTRAQVATFLWKSQGGVTVPGTSSFADVASDAYYYKAVLWAVENGITGGVGNNRFGPDQTCTRGQIATFLYKALTDN